MKHHFTSLLRALCLSALCLCLPATSFANDYEIRIGTDKYTIIDTTEVEYTYNFDENLTELIIPGTITYEGVTYTVTQIGQTVLLKSKKATKKVTIPSTVKKIRAGAFKDAEALTELSIPSSVKSIECFILKNSGVKKLTIQNTWLPLVTEADAFVSDNLEEVYIGRNLQYVRNVDVYIRPVADLRTPMFSPKLKKITLESAATRISYVDTYTIRKEEHGGGYITYEQISGKVYPFGEQPLLEELAFAYGDAKYIYTDDFKNWGVKNISINQCYVYANDTNGGGTVSPFSEIANLKKVTFPHWGTVTPRLFEGCKSLEEVELNRVSSIKNYAFRNCSSLKSMTLSSYLNSVGTLAFSGCTGLKNITIEDSEYTLEVGNWPFPNSVENLYVGRNLTVSYLFSHTFPNNLPNVTSLTFGDKVTEIADHSFSGVHKLTQLDIPTTVTSIGENSFGYCTSLTDLSIPSSVKTIKNGAFSDSDGLKSVRFEDGETPVNLDINAFQNSPNIETVYIGRDVVNSNSSSASAFSERVNIADVLFGNQVTAIPKYLFKSCPGIKSLSIPGSVNSIGAHAFNGCSIADLTIEDSEEALSADNSAFSGNPVASLYLGRDNTLSFTDSETLSTVTFSDIVTAINDNAFSNCKLLSEITLPQALTTIGNSAFSDCNGLTVLTLPAYLTSIGEYAFEGCNGIKSLSIPGSVNSIGAHAFNGCSIADLTIEDSEEALSADNSAFSGNPVASLYLGRDNNLSFADSETLSTVTFSDKVTAINDNAFTNCKLLSEITLPQALTNIGNSAFSGCNGLTALTLPASLTSIGEYAFDGCNGIEALSIPGSVSEIGANAFAGCSISDLAIEEGEEALSADNSAFSGNPVASLYLGRDNNLSFADSETLSTVTFSDKVTAINDNAFTNCKLLSEITLPQALTTIGNSAFSGCNGLTALTLPASLTSIGEYAFDGCDGIEALSIPGSVSEIGANAFSGCSIADLAIEDSDEALIADNSAFSGNPVASLYLGRDNNLSFADSETLSAVTFGDKITAINDNAFSNCKLLSEITLPQALTTIGNSAFSGCNGLTALTLPASLTSIGEYAFDGCNAIETVDVEAMTPPSAFTTSFDPQTYTSAKLTVPDESREAYRLHDVWQLFTYGDDLSGVGSITDIDDDADIEVYNLSGILIARSLKQLPAGFYIVKQGDATTKIRI